MPMCVTRFTLNRHPLRVMHRAVELAEKTKMFLTVEMSCGQMVEDVLLAVKGKSRVEFFGRMGGGIPTEEEILEKVHKIIR